MGDSPTERCLQLTMTTVQASLFPFLKTTLWDVDEGAEAGRRERRPASSQPRGRNRRRTPHASRPRRPLLSERHGRGQGGAPAPGRLSAPRLHPPAPHLSQLGSQTPGPGRVAPAHAGGSTTRGSASPPARGFPTATAEKSTAAEPPARPQAASCSACRNAMPAVPRRPRKRSWARTVRREGHAAAGRRPRAEVPPPEAHGHARRRRSGEEVGGSEARPSKSCGRAGVQVISGVRGGAPGEAPRRAAREGLSPAARRASWPGPRPAPEGAPRRERESGLGDGDWGSCLGFGGGFVSTVVKCT